MVIQQATTVWKRPSGGGRGRKRVTMTDVARLAECSQSTVSIVLNGAAGIHISEPTRQRVFDAARTLHYRRRVPLRNGAARAKQLVLLIDQVATSHDPMVAIDSAAELAWRNRHLLSVFKTDNDPEYERRILELAVRNGAHGIIYATEMTREVTPPAELYSLPAPVVLLNCFAADGDFPSVVPGDVAGGHRATRALIEAGHTRIAHIAGEIWMDAASHRLHGYREALATADIPFRPEYVREGNWQAAVAARCFHELMDLADPPSAVFCASDRMAVGCYQAIRERGLRLPGDISLIGFDDDPLARHLTPALTSLESPHRAMGRWAVERVLADASPGGHRSVSRITKLECRLVERDSVGPPN